MGINSDMNEQLNGYDNRFMSDLRHIGSDSRLAGWIGFGEAGAPGGWLSHGGG
jgi:hypothetical protein